MRLYYQDYEALSPLRTAIRFLQMFVVGQLCKFIVALVIGRINVLVLSSSMSPAPPSLLTPIHSHRAHHQ